MAIDVRLPEIGDGIESGDVLQVLVREGDLIEKNQDIIELETDKATTGVPSMHAGRVTKIHVSEGETVPIGGTLITLETAESRATPKPVEPRKPEHVGPKEDEQVTSSSPRKATEKSEPVGRTESTAPPADRTSTTKASGAKPTHAATPVRPGPDSPAPPGGQVAAGPAIRRFAREVGVDLKRVTGTGEGARITREDVLAVVRSANRVAADAGDKDVDRWGPIHTEKLTKVRKTIASKMHESWSTVPRVTNFDDADVTELEEFRQDSKGDYAKKGIKLTTLPFLVKAVSMALKSHPLINAALDLENNQVVYKNYVNVGIAVDTERGLVVPCLRDADKLSIPDIARSLAELAEKVRTGEFSIDDLRGGTFTISNLGAIGGTYSTPIINVPEVAILLCGRSRKMPVVVNDHVAPRLMMPLSLSYDHRLVDGATAARFLNDLIDYLRTPSRLLLAP